MAQLCLWTKIRTKQWLVLGVSAFQCMRAGFLSPKCNNFACLHTRQDQNELHLKIHFFSKIGIFCKCVEGPLSEAYTQLYSFGERIKLIICQIRHKLSVTLHEIKKFRWRTLYFVYEAICKLYTLSKEVQDRSWFVRTHIEILRAHGITRVYLPSVSLI